MGQTCPFCDGEIVGQCRCMRGDSICVNGHAWHHCKDHPERIVEGLSDHAMDGCTCVRSKTWRLDGPVRVPVETV